MIYKIAVWQPMKDRIGEEVIEKFPCSKCDKLVDQIHAVNEDIQLCADCYNPIWDRT